jgi:hypothetical protein
MGETATSHFPQSLRLVMSHAALKHPASFWADSHFWPSFHDRAFQKLDPFEALWHIALAIVLAPFKLRCCDIDTCWE